MCEGLGVSKSNSAFFVYPDGDFLKVPGAPGSGFETNLPFLLVEGLGS